MNRFPYSHKVKAQGFSVAVSAPLIGAILSCCKDVFLRPELDCVFHRLRKDFSDEVAEFGEKLSPLVINKRMENKVLLGAKITFYYENDNEK